MSDFMSWILSILGVVIIGAILDIFLSEKKLGKLIRSVFASLVVLIIVTPLPALLSGTSGCSNFENGGIELDQGFLDYANAKKLRALEQGLEKALEENGCKNAKAQITAEVGSEIIISAVKLDLSGASYGGASANIHNNVEARAYAAQTLKIGIEKIVII